MSDEPLAAAALDLLGAANHVTVHDGVVPAGASLPYVLVYAMVERPTGLPDHSLTGDSSRARVTWTCHCVGATAASARIMAGLVRGALLDVVPTVTGWTCGPIRQAEALPPDADETTGTLVMDAISVYQMIAVPA